MPGTRRYATRFRRRAAPQARHTRAAAAGLRSDDSSIVLQCRADASERGAHLREHRAERPAEPVGDLLECDAAVPELDHLTLRAWERAYRAADGDAALAL